jgi:hypothetical protein
MYEIGRKREETFRTVGEGTYQRSTWTTLTGITITLYFGIQKISALWGLTALVWVPSLLNALHTGIL